MLLVIGDQLHIAVGEQFDVDVVTDVLWGLDVGTLLGRPTRPQIGYQLVVVPGAKWIGDDKAVTL